MSQIKSCFFLLFLLVILSPASVFGQIWLEHEAIYDEADGYLQGEEYEEAIPLFQLLEKKGISNANVSYKLGVCYLGVEGKRHKAVPYLESAIQNTSSSYVNKISEQKSPEDAYLKLGIAYRIANKFDKSLEAFEKYKTTLETDAEKNVVDAYASQVEVARFFKESDAHFGLRYINDNSNYSLSNPVVLTDSLIFYMEDRPFYEAVVSGAIKDNVIIERANLTPQIGTEDELELISVADNGNMLIFRAYEAGKGYELFYSLRGEDGYGEYIAFEPPINSPSNEMFASVSEAGNVMYFSSNRPGGKGGTDIYTTIKGENGKWGTPKNLGPLVNSAQNEVVCYIASGDSVLYLSSQGHINSGGYDLFYTISNSKGEWSAPVNFGFPVSTADDDNFISVSLDNQLYTSRFSDESGGQKGVFLVDPIAQDVQKRVLVYSSLEFNDVVKPREVSYIISSIPDEDVVKRGVTNDGGSAKNYLDPGSYMFAYVYSDKIKASQTLVIKDDTQVNELYLSTPSWVVSEQEKQPIVFTIDDILFDFNSVALLAKYHSMLDSLVNGVLKGDIAHIQLVGHSDAVGKSDYNKQLSYKRALAVAAYLKEKGLPAEKLSVLSKGEQKPVAKNSNPDGTDNPVGRKYNRRVEIEIATDGVDYVVRKSQVIPEDLRVP